MVRFFPQVVLVEQFEACELNRFPGNVAFVGAEFQNGFTPSIHVHDDLYFRMQLDVLVVFDHALRKAVYNQNFGRQVVVTNNFCQII